MLPRQRPRGFTVLALFPTLFDHRLSSMLCMYSRLRFLDYCTLFDHRLSSTLHTYSRLRFQSTVFFCFPNRYLCCAVIATAVFDLSVYSHWQLVLWFVLHKVPLPLPFFTFRRCLCASLHAYCYVVFYICYLVSLMLSVLEWPFELLSCCKKVFLFDLRLLCLG
jgi:hypothetical protein